jgi:hypothetical protein
VPYARFLAGTRWTVLSRGVLVVGVFDFVLVVAFLAVVFAVALDLGFGFAVF